MKKRKKNVQKCKKILCIQSYLYPNSPFFFSWTFSIFFMIFLRSFFETTKDRFMLVSFDDIHSELVLHFVDFFRESFQLGSPLNNSFARGFRRTISNVFSTSLCLLIKLFLTNLIISVSRMELFNEKNNFCFFNCS